jgi:hypothetical protein
LSHLDYLGWTYAIGNWVFSSEKADEEVFLSVEREALPEIALCAETPVKFASSVDAADSFIGAVRKQLGRGAGWDLKGQSRGAKPPGCLGLLAFQVFAAFTMIDDGEWTANAYWPRLNQLLEDEGSGYPGNLDGNLHQYLWRDILQEWANDEQFQDGRQGYLLLPEREETGKRRDHVGLPLSQALLRSEDRRRLPELYSKTRLVPGEALSPVQLRRLAGNELFEASFLTPHARRVLQGERAAAALAQICQHLAQWDGTPYEKRTRQRNKAVRVWCRYLEKRGVVEGGFAFRNDRNNWERIPAVSLDQALAQKPKREGLNYVPFRHEYRLLVKDPVTAMYVEQRECSAGDQVLLLARKQSARHLAGSSGPIVPQKAVGLSTLEGLPKGWTLFSFGVASPVPRSISWPWREFIESRSASIKLDGGLKLSRSVWLEGSGPVVRIDGEIPERVWIDGRPIPLLGDSLLDVTILHEAGDHDIWLPGARNRKLSYRVSPPRIRLAESMAWLKPEGEEWPAQVVGARDEHDGILVGLSLIGHWPNQEAPNEPSPIWLRRKLIVAFRRRCPHIITTPERDRLSRDPHPLIRHILRHSDLSFATAGGSDES